MPVPHKYVSKAGVATWKVRLRAHGRNTSETFHSKSEALAFCRMVKQVGAEAAVAEREMEHQGETVDELAEAFFHWKESDPDVRSDRTVADYRRDYRNWIQPTFGYLPASAVDERKVQEWVDAMVAGRLNGKRLEPKSVADRHFVLHSIYLWAMAPARRLVQYDPCAATRLPKRRKKPPKGLRPAEWGALYPALRQIDPDAADLAEFLLATGWRVSEAGALSSFEVEDLCSCNQDGCSCPLFVTMGRVIRRNAAGQHVIVEDAKSRAGERRIQLDPDAAATVRRRLAKVKGNGLVFTTRTGTQWHHANFTNRYWNKAVTVAGLSRKPTPHWLRHTSVAWFNQTGQVSLPELQRRIGHENIGTTIDVYGRMIDDVSSEALQRFAAIRRVALSSSQPVPELDTGDERPPHIRG